MSTRRRIAATLDGRVAVFTGWHVADLIKEAGGKPIYSGSAGGWMIDRHRLADVLAYLDERNIAVTVAEQERPSVETSWRQPDSGDLVEDGGLW